MDYAIEYSLMGELYNDMTGESEANEGVKEFFSKIGRGIKRLIDMIITAFKTAIEKIGSWFSKKRASSGTDDPVLNDLARKECALLTTTNKCAGLLTDSCKGIVMNRVSEEQVERIDAQLADTEEKLDKILDQAEAYCADKGIPFTDFLYAADDLKARIAPNTKQLLLTCCEDLKKINIPENVPASYIGSGSGIHADDRSRPVNKISSQAIHANTNTTNVMVKASSRIAAINAKVFATGRVYGPAKK